MSKKNGPELLPIVQELKAILDELSLSPETATSFIRHITSRQLRRWLDGSSLPSSIYQNEILKAIRKLKKLRKT